jgi:ABC-2 type transport system permease protein
MLALVVSASITALAVSSLLATFAIRSGSAEVVQGAFPLVFMLMFLSSAFMPRTLMTGWYRDVVEKNPVTYLVEGMRMIVLQDSVTYDALIRAWGIPAAGSIVAMYMCLRALRHRLAAQ